MITLASKNDTAALKSFALTMSWAFPSVFGLLLPWLFSYSLQLWPLIISALLLGGYFLHPPSLYYPYRLWMSIALVLGWINTRIILGLVFYAMILPIGLLMRSLGKLQYCNCPAAKNNSYYHSPSSDSDKKRLEYPF